jgi:hypothetical protein
MQEMVQTRRKTDAEQRYDLFSGLLDASPEDDEDGDHGPAAPLNDRELLGNYLTPHGFASWDSI